MPGSHFVSLLEPSHEDPTGQSSQLVRVVLSPPEVKDPCGHVLQLPAAAWLYLASSPHGVHVLEPTAANLPAAHSTTTLVPSQAEPDGQMPQDVAGPNWTLLLSSHAESVQMKKPSGQSSQ